MTAHYQDLLASSNATTALRSAFAETLHDTLSKINGDDVAGQSLAAAALISAKVTRNLDGIAKVTSRAGRDHYGRHDVAVLIGKNIAQGVVGGVTLQNGALVASDIDSATGTAVGTGDIPKDQTHAAMARTLGVALGIPSAALDADFAPSAGGNVVPTALTVAM